MSAGFEKRYLLGVLTLALGLSLTVSAAFAKSTATAQNTTPKKRSPTAAATYTQSVSNSTPATIDKGETFESLSEGSLNVTVTNTLSITIPNKGPSDFNLSAGGEYFLRDRLSVGGLFGIATSGGATTFSVGPAGSYYFYNKDRIAVSGRSSFTLLNVSGATSSNYFRYSIGADADYFITKSVSFGPEARMNFYFGGDNLARNFELQLLGRFNIYL